MNKKASTNIFSFFISIFLLIFIGSCKNEKIKPEELNKDTLAAEVLPDQISRNFEAQFYDSSFTKAILYAKTAKIYSERQETLLEGGLKVEFADEKTGEIGSVLTADSGRIDDKTKDMFAFGDVVVVSKKRRTRLDTDLLMWNNSEKKLYSTEFVRIDSPEEIIEGYGFESDLQLENYVIKRVSGEKKIS